MMSPALQLDLPVHAAVCVLIWLVQIIIYPSFAAISVDQFPQFHASYTQKISLFVVPLLGAQLWLSIARVWSEPGPLPWVVLGLVLVGWVSTFALSVPCHNQLTTAGKDLAAIDRLIQTNWVRTIAWSAAFVVAGLDRYLSRGG